MQNYLVHFFGKIAKNMEKVQKIAGKMGTRSAPLADLLFFSVASFCEPQTLGIEPQGSEKASSTKGRTSRAALLMRPFFVDFGLNSKSLRLTKTSNPVVVKQKVAVALRTWGALLRCSFIGVQPTFVASLCY